METEQTKIPLGTQLKIWGKLSTLAIITILTIQGAVSMTHKQWVQVAMGSQANAAEYKPKLKPLTTETLKVPTIDSVELQNCHEELNALKGLPMPKEPR